MSSSKSTRSSVSFSHSLPIRVRRLKMKRAPSLRYMDVKRLQRVSRAEIELGYVETGCCKRVIKATVRKGMVTKVGVDDCPCTKTRSPDPELKRLLNIARKRIGAGGSSVPRLPQPVAEFMRDQGGGPGDPDNPFKPITCLEICIVWECFVCCQNWYTGQWMCGRTIVIKD